MSKFQRKLAEKMGEEKMTISVRDYKKLKSELDELKEESRQWEKLSLVRLSNTNQSLEQELQTLKGLNDSWPLKDILKKLIEGADILLNKKDYDGHGWEEISLARKMAKDKLKALLTPKK